MIDEKTREKLREPLPAEAVSPHPSKPYLSTIKAIFVVERLNSIFGVGGWKVENTFIEKVDKMVVVKSVFTYKDIYIEAFGGNDNADLGDAYKGACTDALTKIGSYLEIGIDVFKGKATTGQITPQKAYTAPNSTNTTNYALKTSYAPKIEGKKCPDCSGKFIKNPKTGSVFCENKCWLPENNHFKIAKDAGFGLKEVDEIPVDELNFKD